MTREDAMKILQGAIKKPNTKDGYLGQAIYMAIKALEQEPLTDEEQRIFLAAIGREEKICREADEKFPYKMPYEESMVSVCRSIERKVKKALWR